MRWAASAFSSFALLAAGPALAATPSAHIGTAVTHTIHVEAIPPTLFVEQALCIHSGWHYTARRRHGAPEYVLWHHGYWRTWDVPNSERGGVGEGSWTASTGNGYFGGLQFLWSTWTRAGGTGDPSKASPAEQIYRAFVIWRSHGGSWSEWGDTRTACGLA